MSWSHEVVWRLELNTRYNTIKKLTTDWANITLPNVVAPQNHGISHILHPPPSPTRGDGEGLFTFLSAQAKTGPISLSSGLSKDKKFDLIYCGIHKYEIKNVTSWSSPDANGGTIRTPERLTEQQYVCFFRPRVRKIWSPVSPFAGGRRNRLLIWDGLDNHVSFTVCQSLICWIFLFCPTYQTGARDALKQSSTIFDIVEKSSA